MSYYREQVRKDSLFETSDIFVVLSKHCKEVKFLYLVYIGNDIQFQ